MFFQWFVAPEDPWGPKSRLAKAAGADCTPLWREAHFEVKTPKIPHVRAAFGRWSVVCGRRKRFCTLPKVSKTWGFCGSFNNVGRRRAFEEDVQRCISRGRRNTRDTWVRYVRRSGRWYPESGCSLEHQVTGAALRMTGPHFFRGRRNTWDRWNGKIAERIGTRMPALHSTFSFWRKSRRPASFLMLSTSKIEEFSQNGCVFDVAKFKHWGNLAEFLHFWCCQVSSSRIDKILQSIFVFKLAARQIDRAMDR